MHEQNKSGDLPSFSAICSPWGGVGREDLPQGIILRLHLKELVSLAEKKAQDNSRQKGQNVHKASRYQVVWHIQAIVSCLTQGDTSGDKTEQQVRARGE